MTAIPQTISLDIAGLHRHYRNGDFTPARLLAALRERSRQYEDRNIWIHQLSEAETWPWLARLEGKGPDDLPLYGIPFAIKDNIDLAGVPTTAGCTAYAYTPEKNAFVVQLLIDAGALPVGKTNLDQFATGLVGTRSPRPWGPCRNAFDPDYIAGGSSSGSAVAVALGLASFSLGTDTAGSGRVPAAFNNLVGLKPTRGVLSASGMVAACRTLDTISIFALDPADAARVLDVAARHDSTDAYARPLCDTLYPGLADTGDFTVAIPPGSQLEFFENRDGPVLFEAALARLEKLGARIVERDFGPFFEAARLLYQGPWVAERYIAVESLIGTEPEELHPVVRDIIAPAADISAAAAFKAEYLMQGYRRHAARFFQNVDLAVTPTAGTIYPLQAVLDDPIRLNSNLGYYTNFMNLLDLSALALPAGFQASGLPWGITLFGPAGADRALLRLGRRYRQSAPGKLGATAMPSAEVGEYDRGDGGDWIGLVVCGAHLDGLTLNHQLTERGAVKVSTTTTAPRYRLHALAGGPPQRPGLVRCQAGEGAAIEVEVWALPAARLGGFVAGIPAPLALGKVELADGGWETGFVSEPWGLEGSEDITGYGGWRAYLGS